MGRFRNREAERLNCYDLHTVSAELRADSCAAAHPAGIYGSDGCVAGSADGGVYNNGGSAGVALSEQGQVSLWIRCGR